MDDATEDELIYSLLATQMKIFCKLPSSLEFIIAPSAYAFRFLKRYFLRPEVIVVAVFLAGLLLYVHTVDLWSRNLIAKLQHVSNSTVSKVQNLQLFLAAGGGGGISDESVRF